MTLILVMETCSLCLTHRLQGFPLALLKKGPILKKGPRDSLCGVKGVLNYDSGICCFKEVKNTAETLIILAFKTRNESKYESTDK